MLEMYWFESIIVTFYIWKNEKINSKKAEFILGSNPTKKTNRRFNWYQQKNSYLICNNIA